MKIDLKNPKGPGEARSLRRATKTIKKLDRMASELKELDNGDHDLNPLEGKVTVDSVRISSEKARITGSLSFDTQTGESQSMNLRYKPRVKLEVDQMMWGVYRPSTEVTLEQGDSTSEYVTTQTIPGFLTRRQSISLAHQGDTLEYSRETENHGNYFNRTRGLL